MVTGYLYLGQLDTIMDLWDMELDSEVNTDQYTT
jgi:hypothetical protein